MQVKINPMSIFTLICASIVCYLIFESVNGLYTAAIVLLLSALQITLIMDNILLNNNNKKGAL